MFLHCRSLSDFFSRFCSVFICFFSVSKFLAWYFEENALFQYLLLFLYIISNSMAEKSHKSITEVSKKAIWEYEIVRENNEPVVNASYKCTTTDMEMRSIMRCQGILHRHLKYDFSVSKGSHPLSTICGPRYGRGRSNSTFRCMHLRLGFIFLLTPSYVCYLMHATWYPDNWQGHLVG